MTLHERMSKAFSRQLLGVLSGTALALLAASPESRAAAYGTVDLLAAPPDITASVAPNLVLTLDDSGSMANAYMPDQRPYDGAGWGSPYQCAAVIDPRVAAPDPRALPMNGVYYNPNTTYQVPLKSDGVTPFPTPSFTGAWNNGIQYNRPDSPVTTGGTANLSTTKFCGVTGAGYYRYKSTAPALTTNAVTGKITNTGTLYTSGNWEWVALPAAEQTNFAIWYSYYRTRINSAITAIARAYAPFDENVRVAWQNINSNKLAAGTTKVYKFADVAAVYNTRKEFYKWLFATPASGNTPNQAATDRVGKLYQYGQGVLDDRNPYWDRDLNLELSCRQNFHILMTDGLWNNSTVNAAQDDTTGVTLPDGRAYSVSATQSQVMWNETATAKAQQTMADLGFQYWAKNLRPDFMAAVATRLRVPPYISDKTTGLTGGPTYNPGDNPLDNAEIYWNPANDPATWPHVVQFPIGFGVSGTIPRNANSLQQLRQGNIQWPAMVGTSPYSDTAEKIDDMWHMAINSRGEFFAADNPDDLIHALNDIVASIVARRGASTAATAASSVLSVGAEGYRAGYDSSDWSGFATKHTIDPASGVLQTPPLWDAGCLLTGGACPTGAPAAGAARSPAGRTILTSDGTPGTSKPFQWASLSTAQQNKLNANPSTLAFTGTSGTVATYTSDGFGQQRVDYFRGVRTNETTPSPNFRKRGSVLGAVVNAQPTFVSSPKAGWRSTWPAGSPELASSITYQEFQANNAGRLQVMYTAANDGMLHAFRGTDGFELWGYVPNMLIDNFRLTQYTRPTSNLISTMDSQPLEQDVFINGQWRTVLAGSMRLGGRGVYLIDVTNPNAPVPMWEFTNSPPAASPGTDCAAGARYCSHLGYTYDAVNIARLSPSSTLGANKWVALVSSGYFPTDTLDPASNDPSAGQTSLLVIDLATGTLLREIKTSTAPEFVAGTTKTFGLSTPLVYDFGGDQTDNLAVAGDLAGNLWRFDLDQGKVNLMFQTYGNGGATSVGDQPLASMPIALTDRVTRGPIFIVGTGKLLGRPDRTNNIPMQAYYGIRDYGTQTSAGTYPVKVNQLISQAITEDGNGVRTLTNNQVPLANKGWRIPLNVAAEKGERSQRRAFPLYTANLAILYSVIPKGDDPCNPGNRYGVLVVGGSTGGLPPDDPSQPPAGIAGVVIDASTPLGSPVVRPGGRLVIPLPSDPPLPQVVIDALNKLLDTASLQWHRGEWRQLLDDNN